MRRLDGISIHLYQNLIEKKYSYIDDICNRCTVFKSGPVCIPWLHAVTSYKVQ